MNITIKRYDKLTIDELYDILSLRSEAFVLEQNCAYQDMDYRDKAAYQLLCYADEQKKALPSDEKDSPWLANALAATLRILDQGVRFEEVCISRVVVSQRLRHSRLGTKILIQALDFIKNELKEKTVRISAQAHLKGFYSAVGFEQCSDTYLEDGIPHIEMIWTAE